MPSAYGTQTPQARYALGTQRPYVRTSTEGRPRIGSTRGQ